MDPPPVAATVASRGAGREAEEADDSSPLRLSCSFAEFMSKVNLESGGEEEGERKDYYRLAKREERLKRRWISSVLGMHNRVDGADGDPAARRPSYYYRTQLLPESSRDLRHVVSIYVGDWRQKYDMAALSQTTLGPMHWTRCGHDGGCQHFPYPMLQIFDIKVLPFTLDPTRPIEVYGIVAVRDDVDDRRNYLFNRCRDNPVVIKPAYDSLPLMSPARGMSMAVACLVEVDIRIKVQGGDEGATQDLTVVDGCYDFLWLDCDFDFYYRYRVDGESGTVLFDAIVLQYAVEATIQLRFLELPRGGFRIRMVGRTALGKNRYVFTGAGREFDGFVGSPGELAQRFVAAVKVDDALELSLVEEESGQDVDVPLVFAAAKHGSEEKTYCFRNHAVVSVKVSWSVFEC